MSKSNSQSKKHMDKSIEAKTASDSQDVLDTIRKSIQKLDYEESLKLLDHTLIELQNENLPIEDIQKYYLRGKALIQHCENLLNLIEQQVLEIKPEELD